MVWKKVSRWVEETTEHKYRIEKFYPGEHEGIRYDTPKPAPRYRVLKRLDEWDFQIDCTISAEAAKEICQQDMINRQSGVAPCSTTTDP